MVASILLLLLAILDLFCWGIRNIVAFLFFYVSNYGSWVLFGFCLIPEHRSSWRKLFSWKVWLPIIAVINIYGLIQTCSGHSWFAWQGFDWTWVAIVTWTSLFLTLTMLFQHRNVETVKAFSLAFFLVCLASILYEIPWHIQTGRLPSTPKFIVSLPYTTLLLHQHKFKPHPLFPLTFIPLILEWTLYHQLPFWTVRLAVFPLMISLPLQLKTRKNGKTLSELK